MANQSIILIIKTVYRDLSKKEKLIADFILQDPKKVSRSTINEIANELNIADSTFFQFTRKLGYKGFKDFKIALLTEEFDGEISIHEKITKNDNELDMAKKVFESSIQSLTNTMNLLDKDSLYEASKIIIESNCIFFFGIGGSESIAADAYHKFLRAPVKCQHNSDYHIQLMHASLITKTDCAILISHTGLTHETIEIAKIIKDHGAKLIVITSYPLSTIAKMADIVFVSSAEETSYRSESMTSRISHLAIIDSLFVITMFHNEKASSESLKRIRSVIYPTKDMDDLE